MTGYAFLSVETEQITRKTDTFSRGWFLLKN